MEKLKPGLKPIWLRLLIALDQLVNVLLSTIPALAKKGFGYTDETITSVVGKRYYFHNDRSWFVMAIYCTVEWIDEGHFARGIEHDEGFKVEAH